MVCFRVSGYMMVEKLVVPRRKVKKNWYVGLLSDPVDRSHPDVHDEQLILEATNAKPVPGESLSYSIVLVSVTSLIQHRVILQRNI